jgi:cobalt-zinc-cadmium efflux system outer membrane protein
LEQIALERNPTLVQAGAQISISRSKALQAGLYPNPTVGYAGELIGVNDTAGEFQGGFVQQTIITAGKLRLSRAKYCQEAREAEILVLGQQLRVLNGVRTQFYRLLALQRMIDLRSELLKNSEENLLTTREMFNTGLANEPEVLLAENEVNRAKIDLATQKNMYTASWQHLVALLGTPDLAPSPLQGQLEPEGEPLDWETSLGQLLADSPELEAARAHIVHDQIAIQRERVEPIPNVTIGAGVGHNFENPGTNANVQATIEVPLFDRNQGTLRQAQGELLRSQAAVQRIELSLRQQLAEIFNQYRTALMSVELYRDANVPNVKKAYEVQLDMYNKRRVAWPDVVALQRNLFQVQSEYTHSLLEVRQAEVAITGLLMVDGLTPPDPPVPGGHLEATPKPR